MKTLRLVLGIIVILLSVFILFQSCAAGVLNTIEANGQSSGTAGVFVALLLVASAITSITTRNHDGIGGNVAVIVMCIFAALLGFLMAGSFEDLSIWASFAMIIAIVHAIDAFLRDTGRGEYKSGKA